jgi:hypothetical protein
MKIGVAILCVMGLVWASWTLGAAHLPPLAYVAAGLVALGPMILAAGRRFPEASAEKARRVRRLVGLAILFEAVVIFVGGQGLVQIGRPDLIVCLVALAVGLHFFPLARWLPAPTYYLSGLALLIDAGAGLAVPAAYRITFVAGSAAAILWLTALAIVLALPRSAPQRA